MSSENTHFHIISRCSGGGQVSLLRASYGKHQFAHHQHTDATIAIVLSGEERFEVEGEQFCGTRGTVVFINPHETHRGWSDSTKPTVYRGMSIPADAFRSVFGVDMQFRQRFVNSKSLATRLSKWHDALSAPENVNNCEDILRALTSSLAKFVEPMTKKKTDDAPFLAKLAHDEIQSNILEPYNIKDLATQLLVSESYLHRIFKRQYGLTPNSFLVQTRVLAAFELMHSGTSASEAGYETGFVDQSHLIKSFKAIIGVTPGQCAL